MANLVHKDIDVEDWGMATFTFANGVVATLEASWTINSPRKSGPSPKQNSVVRFEAVGIARRDHGPDIPRRRAAPCSPPAPPTGCSSGRPRPASFAPPTPFPLSHLVDCLQSNTPTIASVREARDAFVAAMAAYESARLGRTVKIG